MTIRYTYYLIGIFLGVLLAFAKGRKLDDESR